MPNGLRTPTGSPAFPRVTPKPHAAPAARKSFLKNVTELRPSMLGGERSSECLLCLSHIHPGF